MKVSESIIQLKRQSNEDNHAHNIATTIILQIHLNTFTRTRTCIVQIGNDIMENLVIFFITNNIQLKIHSQGLCWIGCVQLFAILMMERLPCTRYSLRRLIEDIHLGTK